MSNHARQKVRNFRRKLARQLKQGQNTLRVKGIDDGGFVLGVMTGNGGGFHAFGQVYDKQRTAVQRGEKVFGQTAKKLLK
jgi:hypothetical protein